MSKGYPRGVSPQALQRSKEFGAAFAFLARLVDPGAPPMTGRLEEVAPPLFRRLAYPFPVHKSACAAVTAATWPQLIAALHWLVELLKYEAAEKAEAEAASGRGGFDEHAPLEVVAEAAQCGLGTDAGTNNAALFAHAVRGYREHMSGNDEAEDALRAELRTDKASKQAMFERVASRLQEGVVQLAAACDAAGAGLAECEALERERFDLEQAIAAADKEAAAKNEQAAALGAAAAAHAARCGEDDAKRRGVEASVARLKAHIASQAVTSADVVRMRAESDTAKARRAELAAARCAYEARLRALLPDEAAAAAAAASALGTLTAALTALRCVPAGAKHSQNGAYCVVIDPQDSASSPSPAIAAATQQLAAVVVPGLRALAAGFAARDKEAGACRLQLNDAIEAVEATKAARAADKAELEGQLARAEGEAEQAAKRAKERVAEALASAAADDARRAACDDAGAREAALRAAERRAAEALRSKAQADAEAAEWRVHAAAEVLAAVTHATRTKQSCEGSLKETEDALLATAAALDIDLYRLVWDDAGGDSDASRT